MSDSKSLDPLAWQGLTFFGRIVAAISHEIKNSLAIINESAGLIEDLTMLAEKGVAIAPQRLRGVSDKIGRQVKRTDRVLRNLNRFAHSIDEPARQIDLADQLPFMVAICERFAVLKGVSLMVEAPAAPLMITTSPFWLQQVFGLCLDVALNGAGQKEIGIRAEALGEAVCVRFTKLDGLGPELPTLFTAGCGRDALDLLQARLEVDSAGRQLCLTLPPTVSVKFENGASRNPVAGN